MFPLTHSRIFTSTSVAGVWLSVLVGGALYSTAQAFDTPLLVYTVTQKTAGLTYFHNPTKAMIVKKEAGLSTIFLVRDLATREEAAIETRIAGKLKYYRLPVVTSGNLSTVDSRSYEQESRFFPVVGNFASVGLEARNHFELNNGRGLTLSYVGKDVDFKLAKPLLLLPKNTLSVRAPLKFTITGKVISEREIVVGHPEQALFPHLGTAVTHLAITGSMDLSVPYSVAVNSPDSKDLTAPVSLVPGTFAYAIYRMQKLLTAAKYLPEP